MPNKRKVVLVEGEIYHVYNRSVGNQDILIGRKELQRALDLIDYYRFPQKIRFSQYKNLPNDSRDEYLKAFKKQKALIEIYAFSFMPNHYHLLSKQLQKDGIRIFTSNFQNAFAKYFNKKSDREGSVFRNPFKAKWIENNEIFTHVSRYIHLNPVTSYIIRVEDLATYPWTSYRFYKGNVRGDLIKTEFLLKIMGSSKKYQKFVENQVDYQRKLHLIKSVIFK